MHRIRTVDEPHQVASIADLVARLQVLARDHREGRLSLEAYRKLRAPLLDTLDSGYAADSQCTTLPNLAPSVQDTCKSPVLVPRDPEATDRQDRCSRRWFRAMMMAAAGGLLAVAAGAVWRIYEEAPIRAVTHAPAVRENGPEANREAPKEAPRSKSAGSLCSSGLQEPVRFTCSRAKRR